MDMSFILSFAFLFSSFLSFFKTFSDNNFAFSAFLFLRNDFGHPLLYNIMNLCP